MSKTITITSPNPGVEIRYTTNGNDPTESDLLYSEPFVVEDNTVVKAKSFKSGYISSDISEFKALSPTDSIPENTVLADGSIIVKDLGVDRGEYNLSNGILTRLNPVKDDLTEGGEDFRFIIADSSYLENEDGDTDFEWGDPNNIFEIYSTFANGFISTIRCIEMLGDNKEYPWYYIKKKQQDTGLTWHMMNHIDLSQYFGTDAADRIPNINLFLNTWLAEQRVTNNYRYYVKDDGTSMPEDIGVGSLRKVRLIRRY